jgi:hypothetical protein
MPDAADAQAPYVIAVLVWLGGVIAVVIRRLVA